MLPCGNSVQVWRLLKRSVKKLQGVQRRITQQTKEEKEEGKERKNKEKKEKDSLKAASTSLVCLI